MVGGVFLGTLVVVPYLYGVVSGKTEAAAMRLASDWSKVAEKAAGMALVVSFVVVLLIVKRSALGGVPRTAANSALAVAAVAVTTALMYVFCFPPLGNEYKFMALSGLALGILAGGGMRDVFRRHWPIAGLLHVLLLIPVSDLFVSHVRADWEVSDPFREEGIYLHHADPAEDALYTWISTQTDPAAVFVDSRLTIPVFGRRQLYVGLPDRLDRPRGKEVRDGWGMLPRVILRWVSGFSPADIAARQKTAAALCTGTPGAVSDDVLFQLTTDTGTVDVYVVARDRETNHRRSGDKRFQPVFQHHGTTVYRIARPPGRQP